MLDTISSPPRLMRTEPWEPSPLGGPTRDGHPHRRDEKGFCTTCGAMRNEYHFRCIPRDEQDLGRPVLVWRPAGVL